MPVFRASHVVAVRLGAGIYARSGPARATDLELHVVVPCGTLTPRYRCWPRVQDRLQVWLAVPIDVGGTCPVR